MTAFRQKKKKALRAYKLHRAGQLPDEEIIDKLEDFVLSAFQKPLYGFYELVTVGHPSLPSLLQKMTDIIRQKKPSHGVADHETVAEPV